MFQTLRTSVFCSYSYRPRNHVQAIFSCILDMIRVQVVRKEQWDGAAEDHEGLGVRHCGWDLGKIPRAPSPENF